MQRDIREAVHAVLEQGLDLRDRLARGETPDIAIEQAMLKDRLFRVREKSDGAASDRADSAAEADSIEPRPPKRFLGLRYPLACWLDELFTCDSPWKPQWNERKLEVELYGTNDRAWKFWRQAEEASAMATPDALEVFYLCVMLGFRGEYGERPDELARWLSVARQRVGAVREHRWPCPTDLDPVVDAAPLTGRRALERMAAAGWAAALILAPLLAFTLVASLRQ